MIIENAVVEDASFIADAILEAIGEDITNHLAGGLHTREDIHAIFTRLAQKDDTQYSYRNTRIARIQHEGKPIGVCISYDGANLKRLRRPFFEEANRVLGWNLTEEEIDALPGETDANEFYLDTLMTLPEYRGQGIGKALIADAAQKAGKAGKPLGLLCDLDNHNAARLYQSAGFISKGLRPFTNHQMRHYLLQPAK